MAQERPIHFYTVESVCTELIAGRAIAIATDGKAHSLVNQASRAILAWYAKNSARWASNVSTADIEAIVDAAQAKPASIAETKPPEARQKRFLTLVRVEAHQFGGLHAFSGPGQPPENFVFEPVKKIRIFG
jgi:hypothetical protein